MIHTILKNIKFHTKTVDKKKTVQDPSNADFEFESFVTNQPISLAETTNSCTRTIHIYAPLQNIIILTPRNVSPAKNGQENTYSDTSEVPISSFIHVREYSQKINSCTRTMNIYVPLQNLIILTPKKDQFGH